MRCREVQQKLDLFSTQEIEHSVRERIIAHLESCQQCQQALARLRRIEDLLADWLAPPVPEGFAARTVARAKERQTGAPSRPPLSRGRSRRAWERIRMAAGTAAALAAGLILGMFMGYETWGAVGQRALDAAPRADDPVATSGFEYLVEPGGESLAQAYVQLTTAADR
jgi:anti-sigma factor RsiW